MGKLWNLAQKINETSIIVFQAFLWFFLWSHDLEKVTSRSVWSDVRRTPGIRPEYTTLSCKLLYFSWIPFSTSWLQQGVTLLPILATPSRYRPHIRAAHHEATAHLLHEHVRLKIMCTQGCQMFFTRSSQTLFRKEPNWQHAVCVSMLTSPCSLNRGTTFLQSRR